MFRLLPYFKMRFEITRASFVQVFTHIEGIKGKTWRLEEGLWGQLSKNSKSPTLCLILHSKNQRARHGSSKFLLLGRPSGHSLRSKGRRLTAAGWPAALMVDLRDTDPLEQAVFPEFVGGKEFVRVSHKPDEGKEKQRRACGAALPGEILSLRREKLEVHPGCLGAQVGIMGSQSEVVHCPVPQEPWISDPQQWTSLQRTLKSIPKENRALNTSQAQRISSPVVYNSI